MEQLLGHERRCEQFKIALHTETRRRRWNECDGSELFIDMLDRLLEEKGDTHHQIDVIVHTADLRPLFGPDLILCSVATQRT